MNAQEYLKDLLGEDAENQTTDGNDGAEPRQQPEAAPSSEDSIQQALARQEATFREELAARDEKLKEIEERTAEPDPDKTIVINGQRHALPDDEETWQTWLQQAREAVAQAEDPEALRPAYDNFLGRYYRWQGEKAAEKKFEELKGQLGSTEEPESGGRSRSATNPDPEQTKATLDSIGLTEDTKGRVAVETLMEAGKTLDEALDLVGVDEAQRGRPAPTGEARTRAHENAMSIPDGSPARAAPPASVVEKHRTPPKDQIGRSMNAALARARAKRRSSARLFGRAS